MIKKRITVLFIGILLFAASFSMVSGESGVLLEENDSQTESISETDNDEDIEIPKQTKEQESEESKLADPRISYTTSNRGANEIVITLKSNEVELGCSHYYQNPSELMTVTLVSTGEDITDQITLGTSGNVKMVRRDYYLDKPVDKTNYYFYGAKIDDEKSQLIIKYKSVTLAYVDVDIVDKKSEKITSSNLNTYVTKFYKALTGTDSYTIILSYNDLHKIEDAFDKKYGWLNYKPLNSICYYNIKNFNENNYGEYKRIVINNASKKKFTDYWTRMKYLKKTTQSWVKAAGSKKGSSKQKVKKINNYICKKLKYDYSYKNYRAY